MTKPQLDRGTADALLRIKADALDDVEGLRIAMDNRYNSLTKQWDKKQPDGTVETYGLGLPEELPEVQEILATVDAFSDLEKRAVKDLQRAMKRHYLGDWVDRTHGVGLKQGARMIAAIGDPAARDGIRQLYAYCGLHVISHPNNADVDIAPFHMRGRQSNWNSGAHARVHVVAESCIKQVGPTEDGGTKRRSPFRDVYDDGRAKYADATHAAECKRCGPAGSPAPAGSPLSDGHRHGRALRLVKKAILRAVWDEAHATL